MNEITNALYAEIDRLRARVAELEAERDKLRDDLSRDKAILQSMLDREHEERKELEAENKKYHEWVSAINKYEAWKDENQRLREALDRIESMATIENTEIQKIAREALKEDSHEG